MRFSLHRIYARRPILPADTESMQFLYRRAAVRIHAFFFAVLVFFSEVPSIDYGIFFQKIMIIVYTSTGMMSTVYVK